MNPSQPGGQPMPVPPSNQNVPPPSIETYHTLPAQDPSQAVPETPRPEQAIPDTNASLLEQITVRARHAVAQTAQDPRQQAIELEQLKAEYIRRQYGVMTGKEEH